MDVARPATAGHKKTRAGQRYSKPGGLTRFRTPRFPVECGSGHGSAHWRMMPRKDQYIGLPRSGQPIFGRISRRRAVPACRRAATTPRGRRCLRNCARRRLNSQFSTCKRRAAGLYLPFKWESILYEIEFSGFPAPRLLNFNSPDGEFFFEKLNKSSR